MAPLPHESWFAYHIHSRNWLRAQFPAFARRKWLRWRALALVLTAALAGAAAMWFWQNARLAAPVAQKPPTLPALSPIPDLTPASELPPGTAGAPPLPATLTPATPPAAPPLKEQVEPSGQSAR